MVVQQEQQLRCSKEPANWPFHCLLLPSKCLRANPPGIGRGTRSLGSDTCHRSYRARFDTRPRRRYSLSQWSQVYTRTDNRSFPICTGHHSRTVSSDNNPPYLDIIDQRIQARTGNGTDWLDPRRFLRSDRDRLGSRRCWFRSVRRWNRPDKSTGSCYPGLYRCHRSNTDSGNTGRAGIRSRCQRNRADNGTRIHEENRPRRWLRDGRENLDRISSWSRSVGRANRVDRCNDNVAWWTATKTTTRTRRTSLRSFWSG